MTRTAATLLLLILPLALPARGRADQLSRADRLKALYSNQFAFDRRGVPIVTVVIAEGLREVIVASTAPPRLLPDGEAGSEVTAGLRWQITLQRGSKRGRARFFAVLARHPYGGLATLRQDRARWKARGMKPQIMEVGSVFGVRGKVFDSRAFLLVNGPHRTRAKAIRVSEAEARKYGLSQPHAVAKLEQRSSGGFNAVALDSSSVTGKTKVTLRDAMWFAPPSGKKLTVSYNDPGKGNARVKKPYWGEVYVTTGRDGRMAVVNAVPADRLLAGLVPAEIFSSSPEAALRTQAVAARGHLLAKIGTRHMADPYLLCSSVHCQVYAGAGHEHPRATAAVEATRGELLVRKDGGLVDTVYSAVCGGHTEHNDNVWPVPADSNLRGHLDDTQGEGGMKPFRKGINEGNINAWLSRRPSSWCAKSRFNKTKVRWTIKIPAARMNKLVSNLKVGKVRQVRVLARGVSGRARAVEVVGSKGTATVKRELTIRRQFGGLRSSMFTVKAQGGSEDKPGSFVFTGGGWGHGVGMCQTGATGMGAAGKSHQEILNHYYPGSQLKKLY